jgi:hypothetical protein
MAGIARESLSRILNDWQRRTWSAGCLVILHRGQSGAAKGGGALASAGAPRTDWVCFVISATSASPGATALLVAELSASIPPSALNLDRNKNFAKQPHAKAEATAPCVIAFYKGLKNLFFLAIAIWLDILFA